MRFLKNLIAGEEGASMVEYALMIALIGAAMVGVVTALTGNIRAIFYLSNYLPGLAGNS